MRWLQVLLILVEFFLINIMIFLGRGYGWDGVILDYILVVGAFLLDQSCYENTNIFFMVSLIISHINE
jgi:hypothetical protein